MTTTICNRSIQHLMKKFQSMGNIQIITQTSDLEGNCHLLPLLHLHCSCSSNWNAMKFTVLSIKHIKILLKQCLDGGRQSPDWIIAGDRITAGRTNCRIIAVFCDSWMITGTSDANWIFFCVIYMESLLGVNAIAVWMTTQLQLQALISAKSMKSWQAQNFDWN